MTVNISALKELVNAIPLRVVVEVPPAHVNSELYQRVMRRLAILVPGVTSEAVDESASTFNTHSDDLIAGYIVEDCTGSFHRHSAIETEFHYTKPTGIEKGTRKRSTIIQLARGLSQALDTVSDRSMNIIVCSFEFSHSFAGEPLMANADYVIQLHGTPGPDTEGLSVKASISSADYGDIKFIEGPQGDMFSYLTIEEDAVAEELTLTFKEFREFFMERHATIYARAQTGRFTTMKLTDKWQLRLVDTGDGKPTLEEEGASGSFSDGTTFLISLPGGQSLTFAYNADDQTFTRK